MSVDAHLKLVALPVLRPTRFVIENRPSVGVVEHDVHSAGEDSTADEKLERGFLQDSVGCAECLAPSAFGKSLEQPAGFRLEPVIRDLRHQVFKLRRNVLQEVHS